MRLFYRLKSYKNFISIPSKIRWYGLTKAMSLKSTESIESFEQEAYKDLSIEFYKFNSPALFYDWALSTDVQVGGESTATLAYNDQQQYATVKGRLVEERNNLLQQRMYVGLACMFIQRVNLRNYNGIRMRIKTDSNLYKMHISCNSDYDLHHDAYAFTMDQTQEWQTIEIPFGRFLVEKLKGQDTTKFMEPFMNDKFILKGLSIVLESEEEKEFEFNIQSIDIIYRKDFENVLEKYKRPFFFIKENSYENIDEINLGGQILKIRNESNINVTSKITVNEVINPKQKQEFVTFKQRIAQKNQKSS